MVFFAHLFAMSVVTTATTCDLAIVGAGPGGAYVAWRYAHARPQESVCLFEQGSRVGGRVHSMRGQGPKSDLVVEAGAYRFAVNKTCLTIPGKTLHFCVYTPILKHLIMDALKLPTKAYNPVLGAWDHNLHKIVDADGHDAGYLTFVETLAQKAPPPNLALRFGHELVSVGSPSPAAPLTLQFANGEEVAATRLVLNIPQRPLLRILGRSPDLTPPSVPWPAPLTYGNAYPIVKVYAHYENAWWRNELNLSAGTFNNSAAWRSDAGGIFSSEDCLAAKQAPFPVQGSYHDADVRCDGPPGAPCRGFLQAAYMGDPQAVRLYEEFHLSGNDSALVLDPSSRADHRFALDGVHAALVAVHSAALEAKGVYDKVAAMRPSGAVISAWSMRAAGIEAGCHFPRLGPPLTSPRQIAAAALAPFKGSPLAERVLVVNEAFGTLECWAEGSLTMAENAAKRLGLGRPAWLPEDVYNALLFNSLRARAGGKPEGEEDGPAEVYVSDLAMNEAAGRHRLV